MKLKLALIFSLLAAAWLALPVSSQAPVTSELRHVDSSGFPTVAIDASVRQNEMPQLGLTAADFAVFEDAGDENLLSAAEEISLSPGVAISLVFDFDPGSNPDLFRPMQEWSQLVLDELELGSPNSRPSHIVEVRASSGKVLAPFTSDVIAAKNGIRQMLIEDMADRQLNETLLDVLSADAEGRQQVVLVIGSGGDVLTINPVIDRALQRDAVINTVTFSDRVDPTYMSTLANNTRGQFFNNPENVAPAEVVASLFSSFDTLYRLMFKSQLHQTDQAQHTATVLVEVNGAQAQSAIAFSFPQSGLRRTFNSLPLLWAYTLILGLTIILLIVRLFRLA